MAENAVSWGSHGCITAGGSSPAFRRPDVSSGLGFYNLSVYMSVLAKARGFAIAEAAVAVSLFFVVGGVAGMIVARLIDRYDVAG